MEKNGKGMTEQELSAIPEVSDVVLWQDEDGPTTVMDLQGVVWFVGMYQKRLCKCRAF